MHHANRLSPFNQVSLTICHKGKTLSLFIPFIWRKWGYQKLSACLGKGEKVNKCDTMHLWSVYFTTWVVFRTMWFRRIDTTQWSCSHNNHDVTQQSFKHETFKRGSSYPLRTSKTRKQWTFKIWSIKWGPGSCPVFKC